MSKYSQSGRPLAITTPLGTDALLLAKLAGTEGISRLFRFELGLLAEQPVPFKRVLGESATVTLTLPNGTGRSINGIIRRLSQGEWFAGPEGKTTLLRYHAELVPALWLLTRRVQSRIFQQISVPDILKKVLHDDWQLDVSFKLTGTYQARNYCVQHRESDFAFVSRLMEEEGICYFFEHTDAAHTVVLVDSNTMFPELAKPASVIHDTTSSGWQREPRIRDWVKRQELRAPKHTVRDWSFQLPDKVLTKSASATGSVNLGKVRHDLSQQHHVNGTDMLETWDSGSYGHRFDGIARGGAEQPQELQKVFDYQDHLAKVCQEREVARALRVRGSGDAGHFLPGCKFTLARHFDADGSYVLTRVTHRADIESEYTKVEGSQSVYDNEFECIPAALPYRPPLRTPRPRIEGTQTATVVGPKGESIFVDKYGRVKVQFHWDRQGTFDPLSSCWIRVAQSWAGKTWGASFWPRVGHEVVVTFEEGDPDRPLIVGSVYNAENMPPYALPDFAYFGGIKSCSVGGKPATQSSAVIFHDLIGNEYVRLHSERHDIHHSESTRVDHTSGGHLQVVGSLAPMGSGSGGGPEAAYSPGQAQANAAAGRMLIHGCAEAFEWYQSTFPGQYACVFGNNVSGTVLGTQVTNVFGSQIRFVVAPMGSFKSFAGMDLAASNLGTGMNLLTGSSGLLDLIWGPRSAITYGLKTTIDRGPPACSLSSSEWSAASKAVKVLACAAELVSLAGDITLHELTLASQHGNTSKGVEIGLTAAHQLCGTVTDRLLTFLLQFETEDANAEAAAKKAKEAEKLAAQAAAAPLPMKPALIEAATETTEDAAVQVDQAVSVSVGTDAEAIEAATAPANAIDTHEGDYTLNAESISFISSSDTKPTCINMIAEGVGLAGGGTVNLYATQQIGMGLANKAWMGMTQEEPGIGIVSLIRNMDPLGGISLNLNEVMSISIDMDNGIVLQASPTCMLVLNPETGITMRFGEFMLTMNEEGITQTVASNVVSVSEAGVEIEAATLTAEVEGELELSGTNVTLAAEAAYELTTTELSETAASATREAAITEVE